MNLINDRIAALTAVARLTVGLDVEMVDGGDDEDFVTARLSVCGITLADVVVKDDRTAYEVAVFDAFHRDTTIMCVDSPLAAIHLAMAHSAETKHRERRTATPDPYAPAFVVDRAQQSPDVAASVARDTCPADVTRVLDMTDDVDALGAVVVVEG